MFELIISMVTFIIGVTLGGLAIYCLHKAYNATNDRDKINYLLYAIICLLLLK